jgi:hypothetical protein
MRNKYEALIDLVRLLDARGVKYEIVDREYKVKCEDEDDLFELADVTLNWQILVRLGQAQYSILYGIVGYPPRRVYEILRLSPEGSKFEDPERFDRAEDLVKALL